MPIILKEKNSGKILEVHVTGKLLQSDYGHFVPAFERLVCEHGKLSVLFAMTDFHGWEVSAAWEDLKFGFKNFNDIERLALVGENEWQHGMATFCKPFTKAEVRYFDNAPEEALQWLDEAPSVLTAYTEV